MQYQGHDIMQINSYFKSTLGIGMFIGLILGTLLFMIGGYTLPYITFGIFFLCFIPCVSGYFPDKISDELEELAVSYISQVNIENLENLDPITYDKERQDGTEMRHLTMEGRDRVSSELNRRFIILEEKTVNSKSSTVKNLDLQKENSNLSNNRFNNSKKDDSSSIQEDYIPDKMSLTDSIVTKTIVKCLILSVVFLSMLNFAPAILSKRLSELNIHTNWFGIVFAIP